MMEDNDDAVFCGLGSFACLGILQACLFSGLWSAILAKAQAHESQVAFFFPLILFCDLNISKKTLTFGDFIVSVLLQFIPFSLSPFSLLHVQHEKFNFLCSHESLFSPKHTLSDEYFLFFLLCPASA